MNSHWTCPIQWSTDLADICNEMVRVEESKWHEKEIMERGVEDCVVDAGCCDGNDA